jgi:hypothetical protein
LSEAAAAKEITSEERERRFGHKAAVIAVDSESFAIELEKNLFALGAFVCYFPGLDISQKVHEVELLAKSGMLIIVKSGDNALKNLKNGHNFVFVHLAGEKTDSVEASLDKLREAGILSL